MQRAGGCGEERCNRDLVIECSGACEGGLVSLLSSLGGGRNFILLPLAPLSL
jgi:hypothetical protein